MEFPVQLVTGDWAKRGLSSGWELQRERLCDVYWIRGPGQIVDMFLQKARFHRGYHEMATGEGVEFLKFQFGDVDPYRGTWLELWRFWRQRTSMPTYPEDLGWLAWLRAGYRLVTITRLHAWRALYDRP